MTNHNLKTAYKHLRKNWFFSFINLFGLATAMAVCLVIFLYVSSELRFDRFHENADNLYRISIEIDMEGDIRREGVSSYPMGSDLVDYFPEVTGTTRLSQWYAPVTVWQDDKQSSISQAPYAESSFFDVFSFGLTQGNPATALEEPFSVVLSQDLAEELFPGEEAMGQTLRLDNQQQQFVVTGIIENCPPNSHIQYNMLRSLPTLREISSSNFNNWDANIDLFTYLLVNEGTDMEQLKEKTRELAHEKVNYKFEGMGVSLSLDYLPVTEIRMQGQYSNEMVETGTRTKVWLFSIVAVFVLFIAGFNYVNLTIAQSGKRAKEVGIRKVLGANKTTLNKQFFTETLCLTFLSFLAGLLLAELLLPSFNQLLNTNLSLGAAPWWTWPGTFALFVVIFGTLAALYPAWFMSAFQPAKILKGEFWSKPGRFQPRNLLLVIQFVVSMGLIVSSLVVFVQIRHLQSMDLGFTPGNLVAVGTDNLNDAELFREKLSDYPWVVSQSISSGFPGGSIYLEGIEPEDVNTVVMVQRFWTDQALQGTMDFNLLEGRFFSRADGMEKENVLVNQALVRKSGWTDPLGKTIDRNENSYTVIGVVEDFHLQSLHHEVEPLMINATHSRHNYEDQTWYVLTRYDNADSKEILRHIREDWEGLFPSTTLNYYFISDLLREEYEGERNFGWLFTGFTLLAIIIAMLGVIGLSSLIIQRKQKETSIRKVLGASVTAILLQLSGGFIKLVAAAALIALPLAYWYMEKWLAGFPYATQFPYWALATAFAGMMLMAFIIVALQAWKASRANPAEVLQAE
ncbi:MAG: ABC transporter permease [Bacteroidales bacterium]